MKPCFSLLDEFGAQLGEGERAAQFRFTRIDPIIDQCDEITLDFTGVRSANSSFVNGLICSLVEQRGEPVLSKLVFKGCNPTIRVLVESAIDLGLQKSEKRAVA